MAEYKPSLFKSQYKAPVIVVRHEAIQYHPNTGVEINRTKALRAEFGLHGGEFQIIDENGSENTFADIRGFYFDIDIAAEQNGWNDEEKEAVRDHLIRKSRQWPELVQPVEAPSLAAPWPTYDDNVPAQIVGLAEQLGLVEAALAYERQNKNRKEVVVGLEKLLSGASTSDEGAEELAVA